MMDGGKSVKESRRASSALSFFPLLQSRQLLDGRREDEIFWEENFRVAEHQLVRLPDRRLSHSSNVSDLLVSLLVLRCLRRHVNRCSGHRDRRTARDDVQLDGLPGDVSCGALYGIRQHQVGAESGHEVGGGDEIDGCCEGLQGQFEAAADLLLAHPTDCTDFLEGAGNALLTAGDVEAGGRFSIVGAALQALAVVHLFEEIVGAIHNCLWQVNAVGHG